MVRYSGCKMFALSVNYLNSTVIGENMMKQNILAVNMLTLIIILSGCASGYKKFYKPAPDATPEAILTERAAPAPAIPILERSIPGDSNAILATYAKRGYIMIGNSIFNSGRNEPEASAIKQGKAVGADIVLVLNPQYTGSVTSIVPVTTPTTSTSYTNGSANTYGYGGSATTYINATTTTYGSTTTYVPETVDRHDYGAVYFVKKRFPLGLITRDLNDTERQSIQTNKGAIVLVVVDNTPAFQADILVGDVILAIDGVPVPNAEGFAQIVRDRKGKKVDITVLRKDKQINKTVQLGI